MNRKILSVSAGLACLAAGAMPALAGDWNNGAGGLRDRGQAAVPVPAPHLVPDDGNARGWYLRGTIGYSLKAAGDISSVGTDIGAFKDFGEIDGPIHGGIGYGAYVNRNWRWDLTGDFRPSQPVTKGATNRYVATTQKEAEQLTFTNALGQSLTTRSWDISSYDMDRTEKARAQDHTFLANMYYEPMAHGAFRPYIGAGVGFAVNTLSRTHKETGVCTGSNQFATDPFVGDVVWRPRPVCTADPTTVQSGGSHTAYGLGLAGAVMAGIGYEMNNGLILDVGYRYLWQGATVSVTSFAGAPGQTSRLELGDRTDHEIRTSVRWNLN